MLIYLGNSECSLSKTTLLSSNFKDINIKDEKILPRKPQLNEFVHTHPSPRSRSGIAVLDSNLYIYGGYFEVNDRKFTLDDFYQLDLNYPTEWICLNRGTQETQVFL